MLIVGKEQAASVVLAVVIVLADVVNLTEAETQSLPVFSVVAVELDGESNDAIGITEAASGIGHSEILYTIISFVSFLLAAKRNTIATFNFNLRF